VIPEIGHFALILALALAVCQTIIPMVGAHRGDAAMMGVGRTAATGQFLFVDERFFGSVRGQSLAAGAAHALQGFCRLGCS
jgi:hypothetical protein